MTLYNQLNLIFGEANKPPLCAVQAPSFCSVFPDKKFPVQIQPLVGELIQAIEITHEEFLKHQGSNIILLLMKAVDFVSFSQVERDERDIRQGWLPFICW